MRLFSDDKIGCYLDAIGHRVEKTKGGDECKVVDLTLRVQPFTAQRAATLDCEVRALLFTMNTTEPKPLIKSVDLALTVPKQRLTVYGFTDDDHDTITCVLSAAEITRARVRTEKDVEGFAFVFRATVGPLAGEDLEYLQAWHTDSRRVTFDEQQPALDFAPPDGEVPRHVAH